MKTMTKFLAATAVALAMGATTAAQAAVYISFDGVTDSVALADGPINQVFGPQGGFASVLVQGNADTVGDGVLHSTAVEVTSADTAANLTVWVTRTGFSTLQNSLFFSSTNNNNANGLTSTIEQFYSLNPNQKYGGVSLGFVTQSGLGGNNLQGTVPGIGPGMYSVTQKYTLSANAGAAQRSLSPTALAVAVPEPGTWALMIIGFGGAGAMLRSRRRSNLLTA